MKRGLEWNRSTAMGAAYLFLYLIVQLVYGIRIGFAPVYNDFLGIFQVSRLVEFSDFATLYNGFFPAGYIALVALVPGQLSLSVFGLVSFLSGLLTLVLTFALARLLVSSNWALVAMFLLSINPLFAQYLTSPGPDMLATALGLLAIFLAIRAFNSQVSSRERLLNYAFAGLVIGAASLIRVHVLALVLVILVTTILTKRGTRAVSAAIFLISFVAVYAFQIAVNLSSGLGPLASNTAYTVYEDALPADWYMTEAVDPIALGTSSISSIAQLIVKYPVQILSSYQNGFEFFQVGMVIGLLALILSSNIRSAKVVGTLFFGYGAIAFTSSLAYSERAFISVLPFIAVFIPVVASQLIMRLAKVDVRRIASWCALGIILVVLGIPQILDTTSRAISFFGVQNNRAVTENEISALTSKAPLNTLLTTDMDLFLRDRDELLPARFGGWMSVSLNGRETPPDLDITSSSGLACSAVSSGYSYFLWPGGDNYVFGNLNSQLNSGANLEGMRFVGRADNYSVFRFSTEGLKC